MRLWKQYDYEEAGSKAGYLLAEKAFINRKIDVSYLHWKVITFSEIANYRI